MRKRTREADPSMYASIQGHGTLCSRLDCDSRKRRTTRVRFFLTVDIYIYIDIYSHRHTNIPTKSARPSFRDDPRLTRGYKTLTGSVSVLRDFSGLKRSRAYYTTIFRPGYSTIIGLVILIEIIDKRRDSLKEWLLEL